MEQVIREQNDRYSRDIILNNTRNEGIDILKCVCAFLVVIIHSPMIPGITGELVTAMNRMAVPVFFMISGWFYGSTLSRRKRKNQIIKVLKMILWSSIFYFLFNGMIATLQSELPDYFRSFLSFKVIVKFIFLTASPFQGHLWYLSALLYVLIIVGWCDNKFGRKKLYWLIPVLLLGDLAFGKYSLLLLGRPIPTSLVRNWLFVGVPYFLLGDCMNTNQGKMQGLLRLNRVLLYVLIAFFVVTTLLEKYLLVSASLNAERNHYISSTFLSIIAFVIALTTNSKAGGISGWLAWVGKEYSTTIYIIHPAFLTLFSLLVQTVITNHETVMSVYRWTAPVLVFLVSLGYSVLHEKVKVLFIKSRSKNVP